MKWIKTKDKMPNELETVWAFNENDNFISLACIVYDDGWMWAVSNGSVYLKDKKIVSECELDDEYIFTHWMPLPEPPNK